MYPLGWSRKKTLPPKAPRKPKGRKQGARTLIRSHRRGPNTVCIYPQNWTMSSKTFDVYQFWTIWQLWAPKCIQMSVWERSRRSLKFHFLFATRLGAKLFGKGLLNGVAKIGVCMFLGTFSKMAPRGLRDVPGLPE